MKKCQRVERQLYTINWNVCDKISIDGLMK